MNGDAQPRPNPRTEATDRLRVLMVNRALPEHGGGGLERHTQDLAEGLARVGCEVHLLSAPVGEEVVDSYREQGIRLHSASCARPQRYSLCYLRNIGRLIRELISQHEFDVIHGQEFALGFWRAKPGDPPWVVTVHGTITSETPLHHDVYGTLSLPERMRAWGRFGRRYLYAPIWRSTLKGVDRILVDSQFTRSELERLMPDTLPKVRTVPLAVREPGPPPPDRESIRRQMGWEGVHFVTLGRLVWSKGHDLALRAMARLKDLPFHYTIAGEGAEAVRLRDLVRELGLEDRVNFIGFIRFEDKQRLLCAADAFIWPERTHPAFGLVGLEALLTNTPVVATRRGAIPEVLGEQGGWLVEEPAVEPLTACLRELIEHPELLTRRREGLREAAMQQFQFEKMIGSTIKVYREAMAAHDRV